MFNKSPALKWYCILIVLASALALILPPSQEILHTFNMHPATYKTVVLTLILPFGLIWFSAFYAYDSLDKYVSTVQDTREGEAFMKIADGVRILAWGLAIPMILSILLAALEGAVPGFHPARIVIDNYVALLVTLVGFTLISSGTRQLTESVRARPSQIGTRLLIGGFIIIGVVFTYFVVHNQAGNYAAYYLPTFFLLITFVAPYLYSWMVGIVGAYELRLYSQKTKGVLYQRALVWLAGGITIVVLGSILVQYLDGILAGRAYISLMSLLLTIYGQLIVQGAGFALVVYGAKQLKKIEEV